MSVFSDIFCPVECFTTLSLNLFKSLIIFSDRLMCRGIITVSKLGKDFFNSMCNLDINISSVL